MDTSPSPDDRGLPPAIPHPTSADPKGVLSALHEPSQWYLAMACAAAGAWLPVAIDVLLRHVGSRPAEATVIVIGILLPLVIWLAWKQAAMARDAERKEMRQARETMIREAVDRAHPSIAELERAHEFLALLGSLDSDWLSSAKLIAKVIPGSMHVGNDDSLVRLHRHAPDIFPTDGSSQIWIGERYRAVAQSWVQSRAGTSVPMKTT